MGKDEATAPLLFDLRSWRADLFAFKLQLVEFKIGNRVSEK